MTVYSLLKYSNPENRKGQSIAVTPVERYTPKLNKYTFMSRPNRI